MKPPLPPASLSLDLDNKWCYLKAHGDPDWEALPSYLDVLVPRVLDILDRYRLRVSFFVVGLDGERPENRSALRALAEAGHDIASHSYRHDLRLHRRTESEIDDDFARAEAAIEDATGRRPVGYRGPGFGVSAATLRVLARRGYHYDASTLPSFLGPLGRFVALRALGLRPEERRARADLYGRFRDGLLSLSPYYWRTTAGPVLELPVTTIPVVKVPFHLTYLMFLSSFSPRAARLYFWAALALCRMQHVVPSVLLHPTDFLGPEDVPELARFPGMGIPRARKLDILRDLLGLLTAHFRVVSVGEHAAAARAGPLPEQTHR